MSIVQYTEQEQRLTHTLQVTTEALKQVTAERDALIAELGQPVPLSEWQQMVAERDALRADAERYRYLRDAETIDQWIWDALEHTDGDDREAYQKGLDAAVDQAMKGKS